VYLRDEHNYQTTTRLSIPSQRTAATADIEICWDQVSQDIQCHEVDAVSDIDNVALLRFRGLSHEQVQEKLVTTQLSMADILGYLDHETDGVSTCTNLSELDFFGTEVATVDEYVESDTVSYLLLFTTGTDPGIGARTLLFVEPQRESDVLRVDAPDGCGGEVELDFEAQLSNRHLVVPSSDDWTLDWSEAENDGSGNPVANVLVDSFRVAFYADETPRDLEQRVLDLDQTYTRMWEGSIDGGHQVDLSALVDRDSGAAFQGFRNEQTGTWVLGLMCSTCQNPAPVLFTVLEPTEDER
jgi:hypothetical protein